MRKGSQPQIQHHLSGQTVYENIYAVENTAVMATYCAQDTLLPFQLLNAASILSSVANYNKEDDTIVLDDDVHCCLLVDPRQW